MSQFPVKFIYSSLHLNRADFVSLFGKTETPSAIEIRHGEKILTGLTVYPADKNLLSLTPSDAVKLKISPAVIVTERKADFLRISLILAARGKEKPFDGALILVPRKLFINTFDAKSTGLRIGHSAILGAKTDRLTLFGDVIVVETDGMSRFEISPEEAAAALLNENDPVSLSGSKSSTDVVLKAALPERFLPMDLKAAGWITEKSVWQAILKKKKIWVPKGCKLTPAAMDLGKSRAIFEFEL